jgi:crotonobetainyl-CoA:carnitine CoA-transferase CaiB-like acyl-CoA transferase
MVDQGPQIQGGRGVCEGLRVLDFGRFIAAPLCAVMFADLGADVIRVEKREGGEDRWVQTVGPNGAGGSFVCTNRNKRSLTLDTTTEEGREVARRLIATADVVVVNMPEAAMKTNGLDYETLRSIKPNIILAIATAYGRGGPYSDRIGFDGTGQVMSGAVYRTGSPEQPYRHASPYVDYVTGLALTVATMAALAHRNATGEGQLVESALLPSALMVANSFLVEETVYGHNLGRNGNTGMAIGPADMFPVGDSWLLAQVTGQPMFKRWCRMVDRLDWFHDPRFADDELRAKNIAVLNARMAEFLADKTMDQAMEALGAAKLPGAPVLSPRQVLHDPHVQAMGYLKPIHYPGMAVPAPVAETPFRMSATPPSFRTRPPTVGEHSDELLRELGYEVSEIEGLRARGIV